MRSNPSTPPFVDIIQSYFRKSFEALIKAVGCGWCSAVNIVICWPWLGFLRSCSVQSLVVNWLSWDEIKVWAKTIFTFFCFFHFWYPLNTENVFYHLIFYMKAQSLCCFMKKYCHSLVGPFYKYSNGNSIAVNFRRVISGNIIIDSNKVLNELFCLRKVLSWSDSIEIKTKTLVEMCLKMWVRNCIV